MNTGTESIFEEPDGKQVKFNPYKLELHSEEEMKLLREKIASLRDSGERKERKLLMRRKNMFIKWDNFIREISEYPKNLFTYNEKYDEGRGGVDYKGVILFYTGNSDGKFYKYIKTNQLSEPEMHKYRLVSNIIEKYEKENTSMFNERNRLLNKISGKDYSDGMMSFGKYGPPTNKYPNNKPHTVEYVIKNDIDYLICMAEKYGKLDEINRLIKANGLEDLYKQEEEKYIRNERKQFTTTNHGRSIVPSPLSKRTLQLFREMRNEKQITDIVTDQPKKEPTEIIDKDIPLVEIKVEEAKIDIVIPYVIRHGNDSRIVITQDTKKNYRINQYLINNTTGLLEKIRVKRTSFDDIHKIATELSIGYKSVRSGEPTKRKKKSILTEHKKEVVVSMPETNGQLLLPLTENKNNDIISIPIYQEDKSKIMTASVISAVTTELPTSTSIGENPVTKNLFGKILDYLFR